VKTTSDVFGPYERDRRRTGRAVRRGLRRRAGRETDNATDPDGSRQRRIHRETAATRCCHLRFELGKHHALPRADRKNSNHFALSHIQTRHTFPFVRRHTSRWCSNANQAPLHRRVDRVACVVNTTAAGYLPSFAAIIGPRCCFQPAAQLAPGRWTRPPSATPATAHSCSCC